MPTGVRFYAASVTHGCYRQAPPTGPNGSPPTSPHSNDDPNPTRSTVSASCGTTALGVVHAGLGRVVVGPMGCLLDPSQAPPQASADGSATPHRTAAAAAADDGREAAFAACAADAWPAGSHLHAADPDAAFIAELAAAVPGLAVSPAADPASLLRELHCKLAANCAINQLTALLGCCNGALAEQPQARALMRDVCRELVAVFGPHAFFSAAAAEERRCGSPPSGSHAGVEEWDGRGLHARPEAAVEQPAQGSSPGARDDALSRGGPDEVASAEQRMFQWVLGVAEATARNRSSMLQDVSAGRPTEVDYLSGWVLRVAERRGVAAPVNGTLYGLVKSREALAAAALVEAAEREA